MTVSIAHTMHKGLQQRRSLNMTMQAESGRIFWSVTSGSDVAPMKPQTLMILSSQQVFYSAVSLRFLEVA
jgi:hypothetical protein